MRNFVAAALALTLSGSAAGEILVGKDLALGPAAGMAAPLVLPSVAIESDLSAPAAFDAIALPAAEASPPEGARESEGPAVAQSQELSVLYDHAWAKREAVILDAVGAQGPGRAAQWKDMAADILRVEPSLDINSVLAETFIKTHGLDPERAHRAWSLIMGRRDPALSHFATSVFAHKESLHAHGIGFLRREQGRWKEVLPADWGGDVRKMESHGGKTFALKTDRQSSRGSFGVIENGKFVPELDGYLYDFTFIGPKAYVAAFEGIFARGDDGRWSKIWSPPSEYSHVFRLAAADGKLYAATDTGVYSRDISRLEEKGRFGFQPKWDHVFLMPEYGKVAVHDMAWHDGRLHLASDRGLYSLKDGGSRLEFEGEGFNRIQVFDGRLYASTPKGVFVNEGSAWRELFNAETFISSFDYPSWVGDFTVFRDVLYVATHNGLFQRWLDDFSLYPGVALEPGPKLDPMPAEPVGDSWEVLAQWLSRVSDVAPQLVLQDWKREAAEALRENPALSIPAALAAGLVKLNPSLTTADVERRLSNPQPDLLDVLPDRLENPVEHEGKLYLSDEYGNLYVHDGRRLERVDLSALTGEIYGRRSRIGYKELEGKLYLDVEDRLFVLNGRQFDPIDPAGTDVGTIRNFTMEHGKLVIFSDQGTFVRDGDKWAPSDVSRDLLRIGPWTYQRGERGQSLDLIEGKEKTPVLEGLGYLQIVADGSRLLVGTSQGLYIVTGRIVKRVFSGTSIEEIVRFGAEIMIVADGGVYRLDGTRVDSGSHGYIRHVFEFNRELISVHDDRSDGTYHGTYLRRVYHPRSGSLPLDWQERVKEDLQRESAR